MDEREELKKELQQELYWVQYRMRMLDIMEEKLLKMKQLAEQAKSDNLTEEERQLLNTQLKYLEMQVRALDGESRREGDREILE